MGSGTFQECGPKYIMDHGIVVVSFNYRVGLFGEDTNIYQLLNIILNHYLRNSTRFLKESWSVIDSLTYLKNV